MRFYRRPLAAALCGAILALGCSKPPDTGPPNTGAPGNTSMGVKSKKPVGSDQPPPPPPAPRR